MTDETLREKIAACAKCGSCRTVCTLYPERRTERSVARGKIALLESSLAPAGAGAEPGATVPLGEEAAPEIREALADCLLCGRCERNCPNQVPVEEILVGGRALLSERLGLPAWKRFLFSGVLPSRGAADAVRAAGSFAQRLLLRKVPTDSGLHYRFPDAAGLNGRTIPALPPSGFVESLGREEALEGDVLLFPGCVFDHVLPSAGRATYETLAAMGARVAVPRELGCCGLPAMASGDRRGAVGSIARNLAVIESASPGAVVFPCGSCLAMFRRGLFAAVPQGHPLRSSAERVSALCIDYATFLLGAGLPRKLRGGVPGAGKGSVGWHDPCHLSGALGRGGAARELLGRVAGGAFAEMAGADRCCGYGGTFNARDYPTSTRLGENKVSLAVQGGTTTIATACSGCILQLRDAAARSAAPVRVRHLAELVRERLPS